MQTLSEYIKVNYKTGKAFAEALNVTPQYISNLKNLDYIVCDHVMYSKRRDLPKKKEVIK